MKSLDCLRPFGLMVSFGQSSGAIEPLDLKHLAAKGSLYLTRPTLMTYAAKREDLLAGAKELFEVVGSGAVTVEKTSNIPSPTPPRPTGISNPGKPPVRPY